MSCTGWIICPLCGETLATRGNSLVCPAGHTFDVARSGYVNLLPSRRKLPETVGDTAEMLAARGRFLAAGHYDPLVAHLRRRARESSVIPGPPGYALEVGSGTGHYLAALEDETPGNGLCYFGADISKVAARMAAGLHRGITFLVADVHRGIPLASGGAHLLLDVFAPRDPAEFARLLHPKGTALVVIPAPDHLAEPIEAFDLLSVQDDKEELLRQSFGPHLTLKAREQLAFPMDLSGAAVRDLVYMGPSARHLSPATTETLAAGADMRCTASFVVFTFGPLGS